MGIRRAAAAAAILVPLAACAPAPEAGPPPPAPAAVAGWTGWWAEVQVRQAAPGCQEVSIPSDVLFAPGSAEPGPGLGAVVADAATAAARVPGPVLVEGHLDDQGPENVPLSQARADRVAAALAAAGVDPARLVAEGRGETEPVAGNDTAAGRALNRRVEVTVGPCPPG